MYYKGSIGLSEAQGAIDAMLAEVVSHPEKYWQHGALAVVDHHGELVAFAKMDSAHVIPGRAAVRKAWTAAMCAQDNDAARTMLEKGGQSMEEFCPGGVTIPGGVAVFDPSEQTQTATAGWVQPPFKPSCIGAVGVSGVGYPGFDYDVALVGVDHIRRAIWPDAGELPAEQRRTSAYRGPVE